MTRVLILLSMYGIDGAVIVGLLLLTRASLRFALSAAAFVVSGGLLVWLALLGAGQLQIVFGMAAVMPCAALALVNLIRFSFALDERPGVQRRARESAEAGRLLVAGGKHRAGRTRVSA